MSSDQPVISREPPPLPPNHPSSRKTGSNRPPPPLPPQAGQHGPPPAPTNKPQKHPPPPPSTANKDVTIISAQPITPAHPFHLVSRPVGEHSNDTTLPPRATHPPPITSIPVPPKPQNYINLEIPPETNETIATSATRPSMAPKILKSDERGPNRPTSPPSDIFLSNILEKEATEKAHKKSIESEPTPKPPSRFPPPPRPGRPASEVQIVAKTEDPQSVPPAPEIQPHDPIAPPVTGRNPSIRKAPPPPFTAKTSLKPVETQPESANQVQMVKTAESTEPMYVKPSPRRPVAPPANKPLSPSKPALPPVSKIDKLPPPSKSTAPVKPSRPGNPKPNKPIAPKSDTKTTNPVQLKAPSLPPRPEPGHPLYKYVCTEPHGFALIHYPSNHPDMLSISKGEFLMLLERLDNNWYYCANEGDLEGLVLASNIKVVRKLPDDGGQIISEDKPFAVATHDYLSGVDGDLNFKKGDVVFLVKYLSETWIEGECERTRAIGMFPKSQVEIVTDLEEGPPKPEVYMEGPRGKVISDFPGDHPEDLPLFTGGFVYLLEKLGDGWYKGILPGGNEEGIFPETFIEVIEALPDKPKEIVEKPSEPPVKVETGYTGKAIYDFPGGTDGDLSFNAGDVIYNITGVTDEWLQGELNGMEGIFPISFIEKINTTPSIIVGIPNTDIKFAKTMKINEELLPRAKALFDYNENVSGDLNFKTGDMICLLQKLNEEWFEGELNGVVGNFPASFVEVVLPLP